MYVDTSGVVVESVRGNDTAWHAQKSKGSKHSARHSDVSSIRFLKSWAPPFFYRYLSHHCVKTRSGLNRAWDKQRE